MVLVMTHSLCKLHMAEYQRSHCATITELVHIKIPNFQQQFNSIQFNLFVDMMEQPQARWQRLLLILFGKYFMLTGIRKC